MKKIFFLITYIVYSLPSLGQQIALSDAVNINLPARAEKLDKEHFSSYAAKRFNTDKSALNVIAMANTPHLYKVDGVLISFNVGTANVKEGHLVNLKRGLDEMSKKDISYTSEIKVINDLHVLVTHHLGWGGIEYYSFYCFNNANSYSINGRLQFDKADHDSATNILNDILNSIKFTE